MKEKELKTKIDNQFKKLQSKNYPIKFTKIWGGGYFQKAGIPDYICCINGIYLELELKGEGGKLTELQKRNLIMTNEVNGLGVLLYPAGLDNFKIIIEKVCEINGHVQKLNNLRSDNNDNNFKILRR